MAELNLVEPSKLRAARLEAHWAVQVVAAAGTTMLEPVADYTHTALAWDAGSRRVCGQALTDGRRLGYDVAAGQLLLTDAGDHVIQQALLANTTLVQALELAGSWLGSELARPTHELPAHPVQQGAPFQLDDAAGQAQLREWLHFADATLALALNRPGGTLRRRIWPHHFDLAALKAIDSAGVENARSIGIGFSLGDASYDQPYFYVTPWPYPQGKPMPTLPIGRWHVGGWTGAVLTGSELLAASVDRAGDFFAAAIRGASELLDAPPSD